MATRAVSSPDRIGSLGQMLRGAGGGPHAQMRILVKRRDFSAVFAKDRQFSPMRIFGKIEPFLAVI